MKKLLLVVVISLAVVQLSVTSDQQQLITLKLPAKFANTAPRTDIEFKGSDQSKADQEQREVINIAKEAERIAIEKVKQQEITTVESLPKDQSQTFFVVNAPQNRQSFLQQEEEISDQQMTSGGGYVQSINDVTNVDAAFIVVSDSDKDDQ